MSLHLIFFLNSYRFSQEFFQSGIELRFSQWNHRIFIMEILRFKNSFFMENVKKIIVFPTVLLKHELSIYKKKLKSKQKKNS